MFPKIDNSQRKCENEQTEFIKIKPKQKATILRGLGHSHNTSNNFSRRNSVATIASSESAIDSLLYVPAAPTSRTANNLNTNYKPYTQQSWSMPHLDSINNIADKDNEFNKNNYKLTEQRYNYERIVQHQVWQQLLPSRSLKQVLSSRILSFSADQNQCQYDLTKPSQKSCNAVSKDFLDLSEFRKQNSKDCFADHSQQEYFLQRLPEQCMTQSNSSKLNCKELKMNSNTFKQHLSSSFMPYAIRQRMLRDELANDLQWQNKLPPTVNKSLALSYQEMY